MTDTMSNIGKKRKLKASLERDAQEHRRARRKKRIAQHQHWMRVMMEGQSTPDLTYQQAKA